LLVAVLLLNTLSVMVMPWLFRIAPPEAPAVLPDTVLPVLVTWLPVLVT
jgi:hypothetical protein